MADRGPGAGAVRPTGWDGSTGLLTLEQSAVWLGHARWLEMQLFETIGGWAASTAELAVKERFSVWAQHHAWHAEVWLRRLPELRELDVAALVVPPSPEVASCLATLSAAASTLERVAGLVRVIIPHTVVAYDRRLGSANPVADAPVIRALRQVLVDEVEHWREGEALLHPLLVGTAEVRQAADLGAAIEGALVAGGGLLPEPESPRSGP